MTQRAQTVLQEALSLPEEELRELVGGLLRSLEGRTDAEPTRGARMARALAAIAESGALAAMTDPVGWQRELREDRPLPYREP